MRKIILAFTLSTLSIGQYAFSSESNESKELLTVTQRDEVIRTIDNACGDSWCEGDYNFKFSDFNCDKATSTCDLSFNFIKNDKETNEVYSPLKICHIHNITDFKQIKESKFSLNQNFYDELSNCISTLEQTVKF